MPGKSNTNPLFPYLDVKGPSGEQFRGRSPPSELPLGAFRNLMM
jgi:hypothetical protein